MMGIRVLPDYHVEEVELAGEEAIAVQRGMVAARRLSRMAASTSGIYFQKKFKQPVFVNRPNGLSVMIINRQKHARHISKI